MPLALPSPMLRTPKTRLPPTKFKPAERHLGTLAGGGALPLSSFPHIPTFKMNLHFYHVSEQRVPPPPPSFTVSWEQMAKSGWVLGQKKAPVILQPGLGFLCERSHLLKVGWKGEPGPYFKAAVPGTGKASCYTCYHTTALCKNLACALFFVMETLSNLRQRSLTSTKSFCLMKAVYLYYMNYNKHSFQSISLTNIQWYD